MSPDKKTDKDDEDELLRRMNEKLRKENEGLRKKSENLKKAKKKIEKKSLHNLFGHATAQQSQEAYERVCEKIDYIVNTKIIQNRKDKNNIIFIGLYPDVSK